MTPLYFLWHYGLLIKQPSGPGRLFLQREVHHSAGSWPHVWCPPTFRACPGSRSLCAWLQMCVDGKPEGKRALQGRETVASIRATLLENLLCVPGLRSVWDEVRLGFLQSGCRRVRLHCRAWTGSRWHFAACSYTSLTPGESPQQQLGRSEAKMLLLLNFYSFYLKHLFLYFLRSAS